MKNKVIMKSYFMAYLKTKYKNTFDKRQKLKL